MGLCMRLLRVLSHSTGFARLVRSRSKCLPIFTQSDLEGVRSTSPPNPTPPKSLWVKLGKHFDLLRTSRANPVDVYCASRHSTHNNPVGSLDLCTVPRGICESCMCICESCREAVHISRANPVMCTVSRGTVHITNAYTDTYICVYIHMYVYAHDTRAIYVCRHIHIHMCVTYTYVCRGHIQTYTYVCSRHERAYGVATISRLLKIICLFCTRTL